MLEHVRTNMFYSYFFLFATGLQRLSYLQTAIFVNPLFEAIRKLAAVYVNLTFRSAT